MHQVGVSNYFMRKMHGPTPLKLTSYLYIVDTVSTYCHCIASGFDTDTNMTITTFWLTHVSSSTSSIRCSRNGSFSRIQLPYKILRSCHSWGLSSSDMDCTSLTPIQRLLCIPIQLVSIALFVNCVRMTVVLWAVMLCSLVDGYQHLGGTCWLWDFPSLTCHYTQSSNSFWWCNKR